MIRKLAITFLQTMMISKKISHILHSIVMVTSNPRWSPIFQNVCSCVINILEDVYLPKVIHQLRCLADR